MKMLKSSYDGVFNTAPTNSGASAVVLKAWR
jgi:hypothetical protein